MKARRAVGIMAVLVGVLLAGGLPAAEAAGYIGEFCWQAQDGSLARFAINDMGAGHILVNGKAVGPDQHIIPLVGNAEIVGSLVYMTLSGSGGDASEFWASLVRLVLDLSNNLNGIAEGVDLDYNKMNPSSGVQASYQGTQTLTFIPCP